MFRKVRLLSLGFIVICILVSTLGCKQTVTYTNNTTPASSTKTNLPLLDMESHDSIETAYFALG